MLDERELEKAVVEAAVAWRRFVKNEIVDFGTLRDKDRAIIAAVDALQRFRETQ